MWTNEQLESWVGRTAIDKQGDKVGSIRDIYIDDATGNPEWIAVTTGLFGLRMSFSPLEGAKEEDDQIRLAHDRGLIKDSPNIDDDGELSVEEEQRLYRHYGLNHPTEMAETGSASVSAEITPEVARKRLRRRDADAVGFIDLDDSSLGSSPADTKQA